MRRLSKWRGGGGGGGSGITEEGEGGRERELESILRSGLGSSRRRLTSLGLGRRMQKRAMPCRKTCSSVPADAN